jgi:hypothetical protein
VKDLELVYMVFDVIYTDQHHSVTRWPLHVVGFRWPWLRCRCCCCCPSSLRRRLVQRHAARLNSPQAPPQLSLASALPPAPLQERHGLLRSILQPPDGGVPVGSGIMCARVVAMLPGVELLGTTYFSKVALLACWMSVIEKAWMFEGMALCVRKGAQGWGPVVEMMMLGGGG